MMRISGSIDYFWYLSSFADRSWMSDRGNVGVTPTEDLI